MDYLLSLFVAYISYALLRLLNESSASVFKISSLVKMHENCTLFCFLLLSTNMYTNAHMQYVVQSIPIKQQQKEHTKPTTTRNGTTTGIEIYEIAIADVLDKRSQCSLIFHFCICMQYNTKQSIVKPHFQCILNLDVKQQSLILICSHSFIHPYSSIYSLFRFFFFFHIFSKKFLKCNRLKSVNIWPNVISVTWSGFVIVKSSLWNSLRMWFSLFHHNLSTR